MALRKQFHGLTASAAGLKRSAAYQVVGEYGGVLETELVLGDCAGARGVEVTSSEGDLVESDIPGHGETWSAALRPQPLARAARA